ncbi:MAG: polymer-forming cytoskeletal protein [Bacteroidetes bacterium]|nr:MAG: polymer-forming cytoskeletal protein [Bacteroidota bacterium]
MFGSRNKKETAKNSTIMPSPTSHSLNSLVEGTNVEGTIQSQSDIRIDGTIKGTLTCNAKVIIGPTGFIDGEIQCRNAVIEGRFEGILNVQELLNIRETAIVSGEVSYGKLIVQSGAVINGSYKVVGQDSNGKTKDSKRIVSSRSEAQNIADKAQAKQKVN